MDSDSDSDSDNIFSVLLDYESGEISEDSVLTIIQEGTYDLEEKNEDGLTPLMYACEASMVKVALALIQTGKSMPDEVDNTGSTALMYACASNVEGFDTVALRLIETGRSCPQCVSANGSTALILACSNENMAEVALRLIETGQSLPANVDLDGQTALMAACSNEMVDVALKLIETGESFPDYVNEDGNTALMTACYMASSLSEVALRLIETGKSVPDQVDRNGRTALMDACEYGVSEVALKLIETGESLPEQVDKRGNTALMQACKASKTEVALKLIETDNCIPEQVNYEGDSALSLAEKNGLTEVVNQLKVMISNHLKSRMININDTGFDQFNQETVKIIDYLRESPDHMCLKLNDQHILVSKQQLKTQMEEPANIKYGCKVAGDDSRYILDENIFKKKPYLTLSAISSFQSLVDLKQIKSIIDNNLSSNLLCARPIQQKYPSIISKAFIDGGSGVSADHCQTGKETAVCVISVGIPYCDTQTQPQAPVMTEPAIEERNDTNEIIIQYKTQRIPLPVTETSTLEEVKTKLLTKLLAENAIDSMNQNVRFIYQGKVYTDPSIMLSGVANPPFGITLQAMVSPMASANARTTGGRKTKRKTKRKNKKTYKRKTRINKKR